MTNRYLIPEDDFKNIYSKVPRATIELLIFRDEGLLLTKRSIEPCFGKWHIPGGTIYFGETIDKAAKRIAQNELGVDIEIIREIGHIEYPIMYKEGYYGWPIGIALEVKTIAGNPRGSEQGEEVGYFKSIPANTIEDQVKFLNDKEIFNYYAQN